MGKESYFTGGMNVEVNKDKKDVNRVVYDNSKNSSSKTKKENNYSFNITEELRKQYGK